MGGKSSREVELEAEVEELRRGGPSMTENSSGIHLLELHMPTLGFGLTGLTLVAVAVALAIMCYRAKAKRWAERRLRLPIYNEQAPRRDPRARNGGMCCTGQGDHLQGLGQPGERHPPQGRGRDEAVPIDQVLPLLQLAWRGGAAIGVRDSPHQTRRARVQEVAPQGGQPGSSGRRGASTGGV